MVPAVLNGAYDALTAYQLATLCRLNYRDDPGSAYQSIMAGTGRRLVRTDFMTAPGSPAPRTVMLEFADYIVVVVRGTVGVGDWYRNISSLLNVNTGTDNIWAASGFWTSANALYAALFPTAGSKEKPVIFCGHSAGGSIALLLGLKRRLDGAGGPFCVVTFGAPKAMSARGWTRLEDRAVMRFQRQFDFVDQLPPFGTIISGGAVILGVNVMLHGGSLFFIRRRDRAVNNDRIYRYDGADRTVRQIAEASLTAREFGTAGLDELDCAQMTSGVNNTVDAIAEQHRIARYVSQLRRNVTKAPRGPLVSFDNVNWTLNLLDETDWPEAAEDMKEGFDGDDHLIAEDLPFPAVITEPLTIPDVLPVIDPQYPLPSPQIQQQIRIRRRARSL